MTRGEFLLIVITGPQSFPGEADYLEQLLEAGLEKLHIRKPGGDPEALLERLAPRWRSRLALHGGKEAPGLAEQYGVSQVHGKHSASLHSRKEVQGLERGRFEYVFVSPLFDSISKPGYRAGARLLELPAGDPPCRLIGLGGIDMNNIGKVVEHGWDGAAVMGYIWKQPEQAVGKFRLLKDIITNHGR